jgi:hypothetical protein
MARQSFVWTALPNGYTADGTSLRLSLLLAPRLDPETSPRILQSFPEWVDWPQTLLQGQFEITCNGVPVLLAAADTTGTHRVDGRIGLPDSAVWTALFKSDRFVRPYVFKDLSGSRILSYDTTGIARLVEALYAGLARQAGDDLPRISDIADDRQWRGVISSIDEIDRSSVDRETGLRDPARQLDRLPRPNPEGDSLAGTLERFQLFHTPPAKPRPRSHTRTDDARITSEWMEYERVELPKQEDLSPALDFHQIVAAMSSYPTLLRRLGLVVDVLIGAGSFPASPDAALSVKVTFPAGTLAVPQTTDASPDTRTVLTSTRFQAASNPAAPLRLVDGLLTLDPAAFSLLQFDVDGAGLKVMNFARSLHRRGGDEGRVDSVTRIEDRLGAPALRTAGLMLVHKARWSYLEQRFASNKAGNANLEAQFQGTANGVSLFAEHLVRGYRIDIWDSLTGKWRSLCRRTARYDLDDGAVVIAVPEEESIVRLAATKSAADTGNAGVIHLHEAMVSWTGWSLAAPPPGRAILPDDTVDTAPTQTEAQVPPGLKFATRFQAVKGSLPRLRFGRSYAVRARAVDLAGNSLEPQTGTFGPEQTHFAPRPYLRYEPIESPVVGLVARAGTIEKPAEGESILRLAVRTFNDTPDQNVVPTAQVARRALVPPRVSARDAEHHGKLDGPGNVNAATFNMLAIDKDLDALDPAAAVREVVLPMKGPVGTEAVDTRFAVVEAGRALTYLPDPLAIEVAVRIFDHPDIADTAVITIPLYPGDATWPDAQPFTIEVYDDPGIVPYFDHVNRCLRVPLPKGVRALARLSMKVPAEWLTTMGVFTLLNAVDQEAQRTRALDGQHWMLTPWRVLELVHAVQRPLLTPEITSIAVAPRKLSMTSARPVIHLSCSINTTDRLDLRAEWHEPADDPAGEASAAGPADRVRRDLAFHVKVTDAKSYAKRGLDAIAGGFPDHAILGTDAIAINTESDQPSGNQPPPLQPKPHEFHDTKYRRIEYWFDATTRFREFLPAPLLTRTGAGPTVPIDTHIKVTGERAVTWIPNAAPPPAPGVLYVVPTFGWARETGTDGTVSSWRQGGGLRVYLDRQWYASGYGEMLAVVLPPAAFIGDPETSPLGHPYKDLATQWANDPVWDSAFVRGVAPRRADFPLARTAPDPAGGWLPPNAPATEADQRPGAFKVTALHVPSAGPAAPVEVAPHDVYYDSDRRLWCCDIEVKADASYFPFIRLALARYQPVSVDGAHLSNVVLADVMALTADRWLNVTPTAEPSTRRVAVFGVRPYESSGHHEASQSVAMSLVNLSGAVELLEPAAMAESTVVDVWIEELDERLGEDFGWARLAGAAITGGDPRAAAAGVSGPAFKAVEAAVAQQASLRERLRARAMIEARTFDSLAGSAIIDLITPWQTLWEGSVTLPPGSGRRRRMVIAEYEEYIVDDKYPYDQVPTRKGRRLVFVEHIELD